MRRISSGIHVGCVLVLGFLLVATISLPSLLVTAQNSVTYETGLLSPTGYTDVDGFWVNEVFAFHDDGLYAESSFRNATRGRWHTYNPDIPDGATITGIEVRVDASGAVGVGWLEIEVFNGSVFSSGISGTKFVPGSGLRLTTTKQSYVVGSPTDLWGLTWNASGVNAIQVQVRVVHLNEVHRLWWIPVRIYYTLPSPTDTPTHTPTDTPTATDTATPTPTDTPTEIPIPSETTAPSPEPTARKVVVFLEGVCSDTNDSTSTGTVTFNDLQRLLRSEYGYSNSDFLLYSYTGGFMDEVGGVWTWHHSAYDEFTPVRQDFQTTSLSALHDQLLTRYREKYPNTTFILVGHSLGGVVALEELIQHVNSPDYQSGVISTVITVDSPLHGAPRDLADLWLTRSLRSLRCATDGQAFLRLAGLYEREPGYTNTLVQAVNQASQQGVTLVTVGNNADCVLSPIRCGVVFLQGDASVQYIRGSSAQVLEFTISEPCQLPLRNCFLFTHSVALDSIFAPSALQAIANHIGHQN